MNMSLKQQATQQTTSDSLRQVFSGHWSNCSRFYPFWPFFIKFPQISDIARHPPALYTFIVVIGHKFDILGVIPNNWHDDTGRNCTICGLALQIPWDLSVRLITAWCAVWCAVIWSFPFIWAMCDTRTYHWFNSRRSKKIFRSCISLSPEYAAVSCCKVTKPLDE